MVPGQDILLGETPEEFAAQVLRVLNDPELGQRLATNGRRLAEEKYDYRKACLPLNDVYARSASRRRQVP